MKLLNLLCGLLMMAVSAPAATAQGNGIKTQEARRTPAGQERADRDGWSAYFPRGLASVPEFSAGDGSLTIAMKTASSYGAFDRDFALPGNPGEGCRITAEARADGAPMYNNVMMIVSWLDASGKALQRDYVAFRDGKGVRRFDRTFAIPQGAAALRVRCFARWRVGVSQFRQIKVSAAPAPGKRMVRLVTVSPPMPWHKDRVNTVKENLAAFEQAIREACEKVVKPDLIVLPECTTFLGTGLAYPEQAEPVPGGPTWNIVSKYAKKYRVYIVAGVVERDSRGDMHNSAFIADREGKLAGIYRKVHLTVGESEKGLIPGTEFPVFELDFGRVGILICWDNWFPETARMLRMNGAELLVYPIAGDGQPEHREHVWPTRAMDNGIPIAISLRNGGGSRSCILDRDGEIRAATGAAIHYAAADIDLNWQQEVYWLSVGPGMGNPNQLYEFERRREAYPAGEKNFRDAE